MDILHLKMQRDLLKMSLNYIKDLDIDKDEFNIWISRRIDYHIGKNKMTFDKSTTDETTCTARMWNGGVPKQCTHKRIHGTYCNKHATMISEQSVLRFGDIKDPKPQYDLIKQKNGRKEKLNWIPSDPLDRLQQVLNQQKKKVILAAPKLIVQ